MPAGSWTADDSAWYVLENGTTKYGNGTGPRLQLGYVTPGTDAWQCRIGLQWADLSLIPADANVTAATITLYVRGTNGCFSKGGSAKISVERTSDADYAADISNSQGGECTVSSGGTIDQSRWGGPPVTSVDRAVYQGNPSVGSYIEIDILDLFRAWLAAQTASEFTVVLKACDAAGAPDESTGNRRIAFDSDAGTHPPSLYVAYDTNAVPTAPSVSLLPVDGSRVTGAGTPADRTFDVDFNDPGDTPSTVGILVATSNHTTFGTLDTGIVENDETTIGAAGTSYNATTKRIVTTRSFSQARGTTYYWQAWVRDSVSQSSALSTVRSFVINRLPVPTKVKPT